jgi:polyhydroxyalkanoate synthesis repressor PhaR
MAKAIIRKYGNRRLYDTAGSRYVNLDEIARMIRGGAEVQVLDAKTGEDVTRVILTQIIVEDARVPDAGLPLEFLRQLVVASDRATREFLSSYLEASLQVYEKSQEAMRQAAGNPLELLQRLFPVATWPPASTQAAEVEELRRRVRELEDRLKGRGRRRPARKRGS